MPRIANKIPLDYWLFIYYLFSFQEATNKRKSQADEKLNQTIHLSLKRLETYSRVCYYSTVHVHVSACILYLFVKPVFPLVYIVHIHVPACFTT